MLRTRLIASSTAGFVLSAAFATLLVVVASAETFFEPLRVDPSKPAPVTLRLPATAIRVADPPPGDPPMRIFAPTVGRGEVVEDPQIAALVRVFERTRRPPRAAALLGLWFVYFLIAMLLTTYLRTFSPSRGALLRTQAGVLGLSLILLFAAKVFLLTTELPPYVIPVAAVPLWASLFLDRRTAVMISVALAFLTASLVGFRLPVLVVFLAAGMCSALVFRDRKHSIAMVPTGVATAFACVVTLAASKVVFEGRFDLWDDLGRVAESDLIGASVGGMLAGVVAFSFQGLAIVSLGAVSRARLLDLTDLEHPLLQRMSKLAPGSWEHARAMANLAEAAAAAIHADSLLTRVGAYYHDLGKTIQPKYFVENLGPGEHSPHETLEPDVSADAIMAHVVQGTKLLRDAGIPEPVIEFTYTHHGTSVIEYFWHKCVAQGNPKQLNENFFRYPGMRPRTKETAILMLVDSIEAASRTIHPPERERFEEMVQRIIFIKLRQGQLDESGMTLEDLRVLTNRLVDTLCNVYHSRIRYPWQDARAKGEAPLPLPGVATEEDVQRDYDARAADAEEEEPPPGELEGDPRPSLPPEPAPPEGPAPGAATTTPEGAAPISGAERTKRDA